MNRSLPASNWGFPTAIRFGEGRIAELPGACRAAGIDRPLLVTDPGLAELEMTERTVGLMRSDGLEAAVFSDMRPNPVGRDLDAGVEVFRSGAHDGVVAFGGGSALDVGKLIAFQAGQTRPVWDFEDVGDNWTRADPDAIAPVIAVPTTAGTGSEVGRAAVVTDTESGTKKIVFHPKMLPVTVICDPELTVGMPRVITVGTGMDALSHAMEAFCAPGYHPFADGIAIEAMRLVSEHLPLVVNDPTNLESRGHMMSAAAMGATAFQKGLGGMHALAHPLGATFDTHHGMTNATVMPYVLAFNREFVSDRMGRLARWLDVGDSFDAVLDAVLALRSDLGVPHTLVELGIPADGLAGIGDAAVLDPSAGGNPRPLDTELVGRLLDAACSGSLEGLAG